VLPNLIVIGAAKCGTTSLHRYLDLHPEIAMAKAKELDFFVETQNWRRGIGWYESQFSSAPVRGESSPMYSISPVHPGVPERMAALIPEARLVYLVRDPIERIIAAHRFVRWVATRHRRDLAEILADVERSATVAASRYAFQLEQYLVCFPLSQICVVDSADLRKRPTETMARLYRFLGVDETFRSDAFAQPHYQTQDLFAANGVGRAIRSLAYLTLGRQRARELRSRTPQLFQRPLLVRPDIPEISLSPSVRARLEAYLKPDADRLRELTGQAFSNWSV
jgi:hypothetical protein